MNHDGTDLRSQPRPHSPLPSRTPAAPRIESPPAVAAPSDATRVGSPCSNLAELEALVAQSRRGDAAASATVRQVFADAQNPIWQEAGNLVELAERMLAASIFPQAPAAALSVSRYGQHLRDELSDQGASPLERLAIARVVMAWNLAGALDLRAAAASAGAPSAPLVKAQDAAERRFHKALASLQLAREISRSSAGRPFRSLSSHDGPQQGPPAKENPRKPRAMA